MIIRVDDEMGELDEDIIAYQEWDSAQPTGRRSAGTPETNRLRHPHTVSQLRALGYQGKG